jgi:hypothetical protein
MSSKMSSKAIKVPQVESEDSEVEIIPKELKSKKSNKKSKSNPEILESNPEISESELEIKSKETFEDLLVQYEKYKNKISKTYILLLSQIAEIKKFEKNIDNIVVKMSKLYGKKKSKTKNTNINCGFNKEVPVPQLLIDFLELEETILPRPKVGSLLTQKFKELGLKTGQYIKLDQDTIKKLELDESYLEQIKQTHFQTLLATFYKKN